MTAGDNTGDNNVNPVNENSWQVYNQVGLIVTPNSDDSVEFCFVLSSSWHQRFRLRLKPLGRDRLQSPGVRLARDMTVTPTQKCPVVDQQRLARVRQALGGEPLRYGVARLSFPRPMIGVAYCGISIRRAKSKWTSSDELYLERRKWALCMNRPATEPQYGFLSSSVETAKRIDELKAYGLRTRVFRTPEDDVTVQAIGDIFLRLYAGFDTPLLRKDLTDG